MSIFLIFVVDPFNGHQIFKMIFYEKISNIKKEFNGRANLHISLFTDPKCQ